MSTEFHNCTPWPVYLLDELSEITLGGTPSTGVADYWGGSIPWMASGEVNKRHIFEVEGRITEIGLASSNATLVDPPAVAIGLAGQGKTRGTAALVHIRVCTNQSIALIKSKSPSLRINYLFHNLDHRYEELRSRSSGGGRAGLSREILQRVPIALPDPSEQSRIAAVLDTVDEAIAKTEAVIAKLKQVRAGLLHDLLTRGLDENGQLRDPIAHPEQFQDSPIGRIPLVWEVLSLEELLDRVPNALRSGPFGSALLKQELKESGIPLLGIDNVHVEHFVADYRRFVSHEKFLELKRYAIRPLDVMITVMGTVGRCCVVPDFVGTALSSKHVWTITFDRKRYSPHLACWQMNYAPWILRQLRRDEQGGVMTAIRSDTLRNLLFPVPSLSEIQAIEVLLQNSTNQIRAEEALLPKLVALKSALMTDLLTGRVRVPADIIP